VAFTADHSAGGNKLTNLATPTAGTDAATKNYVDAAVQGFDWKQSVRAASTANGTLASAFANGSVIDGVTLATGDRILLKNQTTGSENGIYTVNASGAPTRATDADSSAKVTAGMAAFVSEGTTNGNSAWLLTTDDPITLATTALVFAQIGGSSGSVTSVSVVSANGFAGSVANATSTPAITISTSITGLLKGNGTAVSAATSGTDYAPATSGSGILKGNGSGGFSSATAGTDYVAPATFVDEEIPSGSINSSNTTFTLANTPIAGSVKVYLNGLRQRVGAGNDFTISGSTITYLTAPATGDWLVVDYRK
jgi:phage-related tail fiber protein